MESKQDGSGWGDTNGKSQEVGRVLCSLVTFQAYARDASPFPPPTVPHLRPTGGNIQEALGLSCSKL